MIQRLSPLIALVLLLTACAGSSRVAVDADDSSLTRDQLLNLTIALDPNIPPGVDDVASVSADSLRQVAAAHIVNVALLDFFENEGGGIPEELRGEIQDVVVDQGSTGQIGRLEFDSVEFNTYVDILLGQQLFAESGLDQAQVRAIVLEETSDYEVESRLGVWDAEQIAIVSR